MDKQKLEENKQTYFRYRVVEESSFYHDMVGKLVYETPKTKILEFDLSSLLGGLQRVQFFNHQVCLEGKY